MRFLSLLGVLVIAVLLGVSGYLILRAAPEEDVFAQCRSSGVGGGAIGGPFLLVDHTGKTVTDKEVITGLTLVYFGYTYCPDACPIDNARNAEVVDLLDARGIVTKPVFISIDPARDTPEAMADYVTYMHERMVGLTGSSEQIKAAARAYKVFYRKSSNEPEYLMDHSTFTYLMAPEQGFLEFYSRDKTATQVADSVACFAGAM